MQIPSDSVDNYDDILVQLKQWSCYLGTKNLTIFCAQMHVSGDKKDND